MTAQNNDEPEVEIEVRAVFAYFGRATSAASCLEHGLTVALMQAELLSQVAGRARRERKAPSRAKWEAMFDTYMAKHDLLPLGALMDRFRSVLRVDAALHDALGLSLARRNHLAHAFYRKKAVEFTNRDGRIRMVEELERDHDLFARTDEAVQDAVAYVIPSLGIDPQRHRAQIEAMMDALRRGVNGRRLRQGRPRTETRAAAQRRVLADWGSLPHDIDAERTAWCPMTEALMYT